jgi:hypothetical protein
MKVLNNEKTEDGSAVVKRNNPMHNEKKAEGHRKKRQRRRSRTGVSLFDTLPAEMCTAIFSYLQFEDLYNLSRTCKRFFHLCNEVPSWDIVLVVDLTDSMDLWHEVRKLLKEKIQHNDFDSKHKKRIRWGLVAYTDHFGDDSNLIQKCDLSCNTSSVLQLLNKLSPGNFHPKS